ncbi:pyocin knob domain-containing protein [Paenibacillus sp. FSL E2-0177]|uniref:pyocin knob domain-containing protein n=1 Tax=Paenibacillus sp. FSL E2-0177 TaxID=2921360 RepID=UPI0030EF3578
MAYNKQQWRDEIPDLTKPIKDASGKQKTDPQTGRPLYELVQEGTRITSARLNHIEDGIETVNELVDQNTADIDTHKKDAVKHITATERAEWKAKETPAGAQTKADAALSAAKTYADTALLAKADKSSTYSKTETDQRIQAVVGAAPDALDTLKEIGDALNNDPNFAATVTNQLSGKVDKVSGKQLSTEDYSSAEKAKLAGLTPGAGAAGSATDTTIGNRTADPSIATPYSLTGTITQWFSWIAKYFKAITGKANPFDAPDITLAATKTHVDDTTRHITSSERTAWNAAESNAKNASIPKTEKGAANGVAAMDAAKLILGNGIRLGATPYYGQQAFLLSLAAVSNQKADIIISGPVHGRIKVTLAGAYAGNDAKGALVKTYSVILSPPNVVNSAPSRYIEATDDLPGHIAIGEVAYDTANSRFFIPIEARTSVINTFAITVETWSSVRDATISLSPVYTGAATTLPKAVQVLENNVQLLNGKEFQKHQLTENDGLAKASPSDLNTLITTGIYNVNGSILNTPVASAESIVEVFRRHASQIVQRVTVVAASDRTFVRHSVDTGATWTTWIEIENASRKNVASGYAGLDANAKVARANTYSDLGGSGGVISNLDTAYSAGVYSVANNATGTPETWYGQVLIHVSAGDTHDNATNWIWQMFFSSSGNTYVRRKINVTPWTAWVPMWTGYNDAPLYMTRSQIANNTDFNTLTANGIYIIYQPTGTTNAPPVTYGVLSISKAGTNYVKQEVMDVLTGDVYSRVGNIGASWTPWVVNITSAGGKFTGPVSRTYSAESVKLSNVASYKSTQNNTGTIKITLPVGWNATMMTMKITGYEYAANRGAWELILGGYNFTNAWSMTSALADSAAGVLPFTSVRFAYDGSKCCILLGTTTNVMQYPHIEVTEVLASHVGASALASAGNWTITNLTSETGIANIVYVPIKWGNSDTLGGFAPALATAANTVPVRGSDKKIMEVPLARGYTYDNLVVTTSNVSMLNYMPVGAGMYEAKGYLRLTSPATVEVNVTFYDGKAQTSVMLPSQLLEAKSYHLPTLFLAATSASTISIEVKSSVANVVYISAVIEEA